MSKKEPALDIDQIRSNQRRYIDMDQGEGHKIGRFVFPPRSLIVSLFGTTILFLWPMT